LKNNNRQIANAASDTEGKKNEKEKFHVRGGGKEKRRNRGKKVDVNPKKKTASHKWRKGKAVL